MSDPSGDAPGDAGGAPIRWQVVADGAALADAGAALVREAAHAAVAERGRFVLALAGGTTPQALYARLAGAPAAGGGAGAARDAAPFPWHATVLAFGDERCVPPDHPASNHRMVAEALLRHLDTPTLAVLRIPGELGPARAAAEYERTLRGALGDGAAAFDVALLGVGADGHTASLFPGDAALAVRGARVAAVPAPPPDAPHPRVTLTLECLCAARGVLALVEGARKGAVVAAVRAATPAGRALPAARVRGRAWTRWLLDRAAAGETAAPG